MLRLRRWSDRLELNLRRWLPARIAVEISHRAGCFRGWRRPEFVDNRSGQTVLQPAAPPASATTSTTPRPPLPAPPPPASRHDVHAAAAAARRRLPVDRREAGPVAPPIRPRRNRFLRQS